MKKSKTIIILVTIAVLFAVSMYWLYSKNIEDPVVYETEKPSMGSILKIKKAFTIAKKNCLKKV